MTWRLSKISVSNSTPAPVGGTWRVTKLRVTLGAPWRVTKIAVGTSQAPPTTWRIAKIAAKIVGGWRLSKVGVVTSQFVVPAVTPLSAATLDPVAPYGVVATTSNGVVPDSWTWHLGSTPGGSDLDDLLTVSGPVVSFAAPGSPTGTTVYLSVTATKGAQTSPAQSATLTVLPADTYYLDSTGRLRAMSPSYYLKG